MRLTMRMNTRKDHAPASTPFTVHPPTIRHFVTDPGDRFIEDLESLVDSMVSGHIPLRHMLVAGPVGSGKRALAHAIASSFGTRVLEFSASGHTGEADLDAMLRTMRDGEVLIIHNFDWARPYAREPIRRAIVQNQVCREPEEAEESPLARLFRRPPCEDDPSPPLQQLPKIVIIGTTDNEDADSELLHKAMMTIRIDRSQAGMAAGIKRSLAAHGFGCAPDALALLSDVLMSARDDIFVDLVSVAVAQCHSRGVKTVDIETAQRVAECTWRLMTRGGSIRSIKAVSVRERIDVKCLRERLCIPASVWRFIESERKAAAPGEQAEGAGASQGEDSGSGQVSQ